MIKHKRLKALAYENAVRRAHELVREHLKTGETQAQFEAKNGKLTFKDVYTEEKRKVGLT